MLADSGDSSRTAPAARDASAARPASAGTREVVAGARYRAGWMRRLLLGDRYRPLWAAPIRVPVLDLAGFAGGLTPLKKSGGMQTRGLKLRAADGRVFKFRSLDKDPSANFPPDRRRSAIAALWQDAISALHPGGSLAASELLAAARVPHATPVLVVLPDDARLGEFRAEFGGLLGTIEEDPDSADDDGPGFLGFDRVIGTAKLAERLNASPADRVDARVYLAARLVDLLVNDLDRHVGQWDWGLRDGEEGAAAGEARTWTPIPGDRDQVFIAYGGLLPALGRLADPRLVTFDSTYSLPGLTRSERELDARLFAGLERAVWDSVATGLRARITDTVIDRALARMPAAYRDDSTGALARRLRARRDRLPAVAAEWYARLAEVVDVHATDAAEFAVVTRAGDTVEVRLFAAGADPAEDAPWFRRRFLRGETDEVRLYLHGGDDRAIVRGTSRHSVLVRIIGGAGTNVLVDSSRVGGAARPTRLYDAGRGRAEAFGPPEPTDAYGERPLTEAALDRRPWLGRGEARRPPPPDRGVAGAPGAFARYDSDVGLAMGVEVGVVRYGFRRAPYASRLALRGDHATGPGRTRLELRGEWQREASPLYLSLSGLASDLERFHFYGLGNATPGAGPAGSHDLDHRRYEAALALGVRLPRGTLMLGPLLRYARTALDSNAVGIPGGTPAPRGFGSYGELGLRLRGVMDTRDVASNPRRGAHLALGAELFPALWDATGTVGAVEASGTTYLSASVPFTPVLVLRAGGRRVWGPYALVDAAWLGGAGTLRGWARDRFAGDAMVYGGAELRLRLFGLPAILPGEVGVHGLADAGRVRLRGEAAPGADDWHTAFGGGVWLAPWDRDATLSVTAARGAEGTYFYVQGGFPF
ncbi:MAG TPA: hypothetical protein VFS40_00750 [Gemmatimonadales bacterium]|nr:hypothetical protein [Gemmatimonadales bacterium]